MQENKKTAKIRHIMRETRAVNQAFSHTSGPHFSHDESYAYQQYDF